MPFVGAQDQVNGPVFSGQSPVLFDVVAIHVYLHLTFDSVTSTEHTAALHSGIRTLNHIYVPEVGELHFAVAETDLWFENYVSKIGAPALAQSLAFQFTDGDSGRMTREEMLFHVLAHGSCHRGNVGQISKGISVAPPRDLLTKFLHVHEPARRQA